jgi:hypothetical protein
MSTGRTPLNISVSRSRRWQPLKWQFSVGMPGGNDQEYATEGIPFVWSEVG